MSANGAPAPLARCTWKPVSLGELELSCQLRSMRLYAITLTDSPEGASEVRNDGDSGCSNGLSRSHALSSRAMTTNTPRRIVTIRTSLNAINCPAASGDRAMRTQRLTDGGRD